MQHTSGIDVYIGGVVNQKTSGIGLGDKADDLIRELQQLQGEHMGSCNREVGMSAGFGTDNLKGALVRHFRNTGIGEGLGRPFTNQGESTGEHHRPCYRHPPQV